ncbi:hypothetical protein CAL29_02810 [Bordetella genomosp. 10]|uniref:AprE-like beta-barrel domain-containing protein n=1 Tax=Bordetella genomosp. 10 TaxID=1416804 RepID=A0A261SJM2_9BORD|nr:HlyD family efflux transporter periplasmic adaptor subunit [Bordetella genomosp. 10]OZI37365.1 hypothetical protein CAL29_02810 [Bordetella genomosp. 10]
MFRKAAIEASRARHTSETIIAQPPSLKTIAALSAVAASVLIAIFVIGSYTRYTSVAGQLVPRDGIVKVFSPFRGVITAKHVADDQEVKTGAVLYVVSGEQWDGSGNPTMVAINKHLSVRQQLLAKNLSVVEKLQEIELRRWKQRLENQSREIAKYGELIDEQRKLVMLARDSTSRYRRLEPLGAVSKELADKVQADFHEKQSRLYALERDHLTAIRVKEDTAETLAGMPHKHQQERSQLRGKLAEISQQLTENDAAREFSVIAPADGSATAVVAHIGQRVSPTKPLMSIISNDQPLEAHLYVQSHAVGHLKPGLPVKLRYRVFPYQKYGLQRGNILSIAEISTLHEEIADIAPYHQNNRNPVYLVKINLERQFLDDLRGKGQRLRAGMLLDASLPLETRRLFEWAFVPLYRLREKL